MNGLTTLPADPLERRGLSFLPKRESLTDLTIQRVPRHSERPVKAQGSMTERRRSEVFNGEAWEAVSGLEAVRKGCAFRMIEPDGTLFELQGRTVFIALEDGYMDGGEGLVSGWVFASDA